MLEQALAGIARARERVAAYFTANDIAAYLACRAIVPAVLERIVETTGGSGAVLDRIRREPERYLSGALQHGAGIAFPADAEPFKVAHPDWGLPSETWIEVQGRQLACNGLKERLRSGAFETVADLLTANLSLLRIAIDAVARLAPADAALLLEGLRGLTVLDPTCGAGGFLLAAFEVLFELECALARQSLGAGSGTEAACADLAAHIVERQLHGVDLLPEAIEVCRVQLVDRARSEGAVGLSVSGLRVGNAIGEFDWAGQFREIAQSGGFRVILGNPPYLAARRLDYSPCGPRPHRDVYGYVLDRAIELCHPEAAIGMVLPLSIAFGRSEASLRDRVRSFGDGWFASFDNIPAALFENVSQRCTLWLGRRSTRPPRTFVTALRRWRSQLRPDLLATLVYTEIPAGGTELPRICGAIQRDLLARIEAIPGALRTGGGPANGPTPDTQASVAIGYSQTARNFLSVFLEDPPCFDAATLEPVPPSKIARVPLASPERVDAALAALSGDVFFWYWLARGDGFDVTSWLIRDFLASLEVLEAPHLAVLARIGQWLNSRRLEALVFKKNAGRFVGNYNWRRLGDPVCWADRVLLAGLGVDARQAAALSGDVERLLAVNALAGEKGLPARLLAWRRSQVLRGRQHAQPWVEIQGEIDSVLAASWS